MTNLSSQKGSTYIYQRIQHLNIVIVLGFFLMSVGLVYWSAIQSKSISGRDDNPRIVDREISIERGTIFSTNGQVLAQTISTGSETHRQYAQGVGPAVGYYSIRHGTSGAEEDYDLILRGSSGDFWKDYWRYDLLNQPRVGQDIRIALDERWQRAAVQLMGDSSGAVVLISLPDMEVRAMASLPVYDPNNLDEDFETLVSDAGAPLLNRATQGQYQPGMTLQPFILAGGAERELVDPADVLVGANSEVGINGDAISCTGDVGSQSSWDEVIDYKCPGPIQDVSVALGEQGLSELLRDFGLAVEPQTAAGIDELDVIEDLPLAAVGYDTLTTSPLQLGLALSVLGSQGNIKEPRFIEAAEDPFGGWEFTDSDLETYSVVSPESANMILDMLPVNRGAAEFNTTVLSGPESTNNSWYMALAPASNPLYAVVVVVENSDLPEESRRVGQSLLRNVLDPKDTQ